MIDWVSQHAGVIGLLFFFSFFVLAALWIYRPGSKKNYQEQANIPLKEEDDE
ncbi:MAG: cbb3-type cytochrome c oxidase subunit 3 [Alphaproteobacteria bacterium]|nr:cbb3-type cytochrome c oxidase subunit 3 [Alphaproteobacteria bacterium]